MSAARQSPGPADWEQIGFDVWDAIAAIAGQHPGDASRAASAALSTVRAIVEKGTSMPSKSVAPARNKDLAVKQLSVLQQQRDKDEAAGDVEGAGLLTQIAALLLKYAGVADEPLLPDQQLNDLKRLAATTHHVEHRAHYAAVAKVEDWKREYQAATAPRKKGLR